MLTWLTDFCFQTAQVEYKEWVWAERGRLDFLWHFLMTTAVTIQSEVSQPASSALTPPPFCHLVKRRQQFSGGRPSRVCSDTFSHHHHKQVGSCVSAGRRWEERKGKVRQKKHQLLWKYQQYCYGNWSSAGHICLGSSSNRLSERSLW